jgi:hypothetical protein
MGSCVERLPRIPLSCPGLTGASSIPEPSAIEPIEHGVLDRPVKPGDDGGENVKQHSRGADAPEFCVNLVPHRSRGRRECRCSTAPAASRVVKRTRELVTTGTPKQSGTPCATVYGLFRDLPGVPGLLAPVIRRSADLTSASGGQDHTALPSAGGLTRRLKRPRPSHPAPRFVTIGRNVPLAEAERRGRCR